MSEKQRTFDVELYLAKSPKLAQEPKTDEMTITAKSANAIFKRKPRTISLETVIRLINWFKQD